MCNAAMVVQYLYGWCYERSEGQSWGSWSKTEGRKWVLNSILFADDTVLIAEKESDLQKLVRVFDAPSLYILQENTYISLKSN